MIIDSLIVCGWRSYDTTGITLSNLKSINLIIGPNNSGKSNLSKYLHSIKSNFSSKIQQGGFTQIPVKIDKNQTWNWKNNDISCSISLSSENYQAPPPVKKIKYSPENHNISLHCQFNIQKETAFINTKIDDIFLFNDSGKILEHFGSSAYIDPSDEILGYYDNSYYWNTFLDSLIFVDPIRHHARDSSNQQYFYFDGATIIKDINALSEDNSNRIKWQQYTLQIKSWLNDILSENIISITISENSGLRFEFDSGLLLLLEELGTGVSQIVMLLSYLWINQEKQLNVFLEEPESNLHPDSVIKLVNIFRKDLKNHRFFITTHSPSLIDCIDDNWAVFRIFKENGSSKTTKTDNTIKYYEILDSLGVKASQILQANTIIWVEGPSDRIYIKKWIEIYSSTNLIEGRDFSFLFFGGSNLASFTLLDDIDQDLINILSSSRRAILVADSDCQSANAREDESYKKYLSDFKQRLHDSMQCEKGIFNSLDDYFKIWVSAGREIENYIDKKLMFSVLTNDELRRHNIGISKDKRKLILKINSPADFSFTHFDSFDTSIANAYCYDNGSDLTKDAIKNISSSYANKKTSIARDIVKLLDKNNTKVLDLEARIVEIISFINQR